MSCRKCGQYGHFVRNCPQLGGDGRDRGSSSGGGGGGCFICGGRHFARECPSRDGGGRGVCYNCHQPGHFAEACPNRSGGSSRDYRDSHYRDHGGSSYRDGHYRDSRDSDYHSRGDSDRTSDRPSGWSDRERDVPSVSTGAVGSAVPRESDPVGLDTAFPTQPPVGGEFVSEPGRLDEIINSSSPYGGDDAMDGGPVPSALGGQPPSTAAPPPAYIPAPVDGAPSANDSTGSGTSCYNCGGPHYVRDCPTAKERACYICNQPGHMAISCPTKPPGSSGSGCYNCGGPHFARECPASRGPGGPPGPAGNCYVCNQPGHIASLCPMKNDDGRGSRSGCYICGGRHFARECPTADRYGRGSGGYGRSSRGGGDCYICGGRHFARECPNRGGSRYRSRSRSRSRSPRSHYRHRSRSRSRSRDRSGHRSRSRSRSPERHRSRSYMPYSLPPPSKSKYDYPLSSKPKSREGCYICGDFGHFAKECPQKVDDRYSSGSRH